MLLAKERILDEGFHPEKMVQGTPIPAKSALQIGDKLFIFEAPHQSVIDHPLHDFAKAAGQ
jgi:hypothetical protein